MTSRDPKRSNSWPQNFWSPVSLYPCKIDAWSSLTTNRKVPTPSPIVTWSMTSHRLTVNVLLNNITFLFFDLVVTSSSCFITSRDSKRSRSWPQYLWAPKHQTQSVWCGQYHLLWFFLFSMFKSLNVAVNKCINWYFVHLLTSTDDSKTNTPSVLYKTYVV